MVNCKDFHSVLNCNILIINYFGLEFIFFSSILCKNQYVKPNCEHMEKFIFKLLYVFSALLIIASCGKNEKLPISNMADFYQYISAYTGGEISKNESIIIKLKQKIEISEKTKASDLFDFTPKIKGSITFPDNYTIEFIPDQAWKSGQEYGATLRLSEIFKVEDKLKEFNFKFNVKELNLRVKLNDLKTIDLKTLKYQQLSGVVEASDALEAELLHKTLSAELNGDDLTIKWLEKTDELKHPFVIDSILRMEEEQELIINLNGKEIDIQSKSISKVKVPSINSFTVLKAYVVHSENKHIVVNFSDPIDAAQNLSGLFTMTGLNNAKYEVDGNNVKIYLRTNIVGQRDLSVNSGIKNIIGKKLDVSQVFNLGFSLPNPEIKMVNKGVILPNSGEGLIYAFEAIGLKNVDIQVVKIFENNILQFLQVNNLSDKYELRRVGKLVFNKKITLSENPEEYENWNRYSIDLAEHLQIEPGAIYNINIKFRKEYTSYTCEQSEEEEEEYENEYSEYGEESYWDYYDEYYYYGNWEDRDNPCKRAYYRSDRFLNQNILASNIGMIAKIGENNQIYVVANNILSTAPLSGINIGVYDYQQQLIEEKPTDNDGLVTFLIPEGEQPAFIIAQNGKEASYIKIDNAYALSFSRFNVGGKEISKGLKGYIFAERGVWRPGDSIYLNFILNDNAKPLPENHPIELVVRDPYGQVVFKQVQQKKANNFYLFPFATETEARTGSYSATISVGKKTFHHDLRIETVKPNRLKIKLEVDDNALLSNMNNSGKVHIDWLHGAIGKNMKVDIKAQIVPAKTEFENYKDFVFEDVTKNYYPQDLNVYNGNTNEYGDAQFNMQVNYTKDAPGFMNAHFMVKAFEPGGEFSISQKTVPYYPYESFVGLKIPKGDKIRGMLLTDKKHTLETVVLDKDGKPVANGHELKFTFYKVSWSWWWDVSANTISNYSHSSSSQLISETTVFTKNGKASWDIEVKYPEWGRYLVKVEDLTSGHASSKIVYIDWPGWAGRSQRENPEGATMLVFTSDKAKYMVGEDAKITLPGTQGGRALVSIENSSSVIKQFWVETKGEENAFELEVTKDMVPNVFVNISLLQPHANTANDYPIRLYGVIGIDVENPETKLEPVMAMPSELESEQKFTINVSEKNKKAMTYSLAIVDDGLLDLTNFRTPDPWKSFFAHEALGVRTYDFYDDIIGAYGGELQKLLAVGGGDELGEEKQKEANRFPPVVKYLGPFELAAGKTAKHNVQLPQYIGSVRVMLVAANKEAYGSSEKTVPVRKPLMLLATLPRVLGPGELVKLPVNVFSGKSDIKTVNITIETNPLLLVEGAKSKQINFGGIGEQTEFFTLKVAEQTGIAHIKIMAVSGKSVAEYEMEIQVRYPNPYITKSYNQLINKGEKHQFSFETFGLEGTNSAMLEISNLPPVNMEKRLDYLIQYPHGCIEQTTSAVFPQLFVQNVIEISPVRLEEMKKNISDGIAAIAQFQVTSGGFSYWPGQSEANPWGTNYAGHFLLEAQKAGYDVPSGLIKKWKKYQKSRANSWTNNAYEGDLLQAYRLYTLALAGDAENAAMNRLKESPKLSNMARWQLAAAYSLLGKQNIAQSLIENSVKSVEKYNELSGTFGSDVRDKAIILETLNYLKKKEEGFALYKEIADELSNEQWLNTQEVAYALISLTNYIKAYKTTDFIEIEYAANAQKTAKLSSNKAIISKELNIEQKGSQKVAVSNKSQGTLYAQLLVKGQALTGQEQSSSNLMNIRINYFDMNDAPIEVENMEQGKDFYAIVQVSNTGNKEYKEMALTQIFPSGWEIVNTRLFGAEQSEMGFPKYRDYRDDRVYTYFDLAQGTSKKFKVLLNASYAGKYYLPPVYCAAMYDESIYALERGKWVEVRTQK